MEKRKVKVRSTVDYRVGLFVPEIRLSRNFEYAGQEWAIDYDDMEDAVRYPGVAVLLNEGTLVVVEKQDRIDLEIEDEEGRNRDGRIIEILSKQDILSLLKEKTVDELREKMSNLTKEQNRNIADTAIKEKIYDSSKAAIIKKATGIDLIAGIKRAEDFERAEELEKASKGV